MTSINEAKNDISKAISLLVDHLSGEDESSIKEVPEQQKKIVLGRLKDMLEALDSGVLPEKYDRNLGISRLVVDSWPFDSQVSEKVVRAEKSFINVK